LPRAQTSVQPMSVDEAAAIVMDVAIKADSGLATRLAVVGAPSDVLQANLNSPRKARRIWVAVSETLGTSEMTFEGGIFIPFTKFHATPLPAVISLITTEVAINVLNFKTGYAHVLKTNTQTQAFIRQLGYVMSPGQEDAENQEYRITRETYENKAGRIRKAVSVLMKGTPQGRLLTHAVVKELVAQADEGLILLTGRYEGIDERLISRYVDEEISIGDYVLSGGELAAMVLIDSLVRQLPGVLGDAESAEQESFVQGLLDCPHYTRPEQFSDSKWFNAEAVPPVLLSGNHADIQRWRLQQSLGRTWLRRPDLLAGRDLTKEESGLLAAFQKEQDPITKKEQ